MIGLLQRVSRASVTVDDTIIAAIGNGLLVFIGIEPDDSERHAERLLERLYSYRVFSDSAGRMNRSLNDTGGDLLLVPQFTLAADTRSGTRPGFSTAATPAEGERLFNHLLDHARHKADAYGTEVAAGRFGADMQVSLVNDGPVTFWLQT
ncbi:D-tyrosyl-tRNA(Tyr) deacylase [Methylohalomonas lacus]|uniref:D-aminoacyl-tRNA deacylase n=1 Tax=Methylohalomonas lacus TaxID=398773 RepID=A0AAE3L1R7_9GAMM|nr:D-aminoacyl-tRNA deacylase [Methylohalomonas lacus]MCS3904000.1 D-tyrosyl-tRNA(Tyr) deacylase [Methylohalomonas lacus]